jgi:hypothetical protein
MCESTHKNLEVLAKSLSEMLSFEEKKSYKQQQPATLEKKEKFF